jgi:hypothetical protein
MATKYAVVMTRGKGAKAEKLGFVSMKQAAGYFHGKTKQAKTMKSATVNIRAAAAGTQCTGSNDDGVETRLTAYGYKVKINA